jgi:hypothetical protein
MVHCCLLFTISLLSTIHKKNLHFHNPFLLSYSAHTTDTSRDTVFQSVQTLGYWLATEPSEFDACKGRHVFLFYMEAASLLANGVPEFISPAIEQPQRKGGHLDYPV